PTNRSSRALHDIGGGRFTRTPANAPTPMAMLNTELSQPVEPAPPASLNWTVDKDIVRGPLRSRSSLPSTSSRMSCCSIAPKRAARIEDGREIAMSRPSQWTRRVPIMRRTAAVLCLFLLLSVNAIAQVSPAGSAPTDKQANAPAAQQQADAPAKADS